MATIKLALLRHTQAKDGTYKIRIAVGHKNTTHYIVTKYKVNSFSEFDNGIVIRLPNAHEINIKLRNLLNEYENVSTLFLISTYTVAKNCVIG